MPRDKTAEDAYRIALEDCYMLARRLSVRLDRIQTDMVDRRDELIQWQHIIRFCERAGLRSNVVRTMDMAMAPVSAASESHG